MKIIDDYLEVAEPEIAVLFLGEEIKTHQGRTVILAGIYKRYWVGIYIGCISAREKYEYPVRIPKETVKKVCEVKEGDSIFFTYPLEEDLGDERPPHYGNRYEDKFEDLFQLCLKANALTIGKTVGELRELWEWMEK